MSDLPTSARHGWSAGQRVLYGTVIVGLVAWAALARGAFPLQAGLTLMGLSALIVGAKVAAVLAGLLRRHALTVDEAVAAALTPAELPVYTVLVPLYREAGVVPGLVAALAELDYPRDRLQVLLLLEEDDATTIAAARAHAQEPWLAAVVVPDGQPRTKPRACNHGLALARGELLVVFDAEDRPERDQLRKAVAAFREAADAVVCLQAKLNCYNRGANALTRLFALEYSAWFDLYLPGLHAVGAPIPLGGTSNHFRTAALRRLDGWDAWNVTEDCDLGIRLARAGLETRVIDSTTWEEAPSRPVAWLKQRSRWMKGYWQTHLAHTRDPAAVLRDLGPWRASLMLLTVGGQVFSLLALPAAWASVALSGVGGWQLFDPHRPWTVGLIVASALLALANLLFVVIHALAALRRGFVDLVPWALLLPAYWLGVSIATWRGFIQSFRDPFRWEKTPHGVAVAAPAPIATAPPAWPAMARSTGRPPPIPPRAAPARVRRRLIEALAIVAVVALCCWTAWRTPRWLRTAERIRFAAIELEKAAVDKQRVLEASWLGAERAVYVVEAPKGGAMPVIRAVAFVKVWDGEWYQLESRDLRPCARGIEIVFPLDGAWTSPDCERPWSRDCLRRVRAAGLRLYGDDAKEQALKVVDVRVEGASAAPALAIDLPDAVAPAAGERYAMLEIPFGLSRTYPNPFDPRAIAVDGVIAGPDGVERRVPAFYTQEFDRSLVDGAETLRARGAPHWALRFTPTAPGAWRWRIEARDGDGATAATPPRALAVADSKRRGFARVDGELFRYDDGSFLYPIAYNIRSPVDTIDSRLGRIPQPDERLGGILMERFVDQLADAHVDIGRVWLSPWFGGLEWKRDAAGYHGLGVYNLRNAWRIDRIIAHAAERGVMIELALNHHGPFTEAYDSQWHDNPYNATNGGPLRHPGDVLSDPESRRLFADRLRYVAARWGADPALYAWTLWIEIDAVARADAIEAWHRDTLKQMHELDQGGHIVSTEFCNSPGCDPVWRMPGIGYVQMGGYSFGHGLVRALDEYTHTLRYGKPLIIEEYGGHAQGGSVPWVAHEIHDGPWAGWMLDLAGAPMPWWWNLIFAYDLQRHHHRFAGYIAGEDLRGTAWSFVRPPLERAPDLAALARVSPDRAFAWVYDAAITDLDARGQYWQQSAAAAALYAKRAGRFDPLAREPGALFPAIEGASLRLDGLGLHPGRWRAECWDTWSEAPPTVVEVVIGADGRGALALPKLTRDLAVKLVRQP